MPADDQRKLLDAWRDIANEGKPPVPKKRSSMKEIFAFIGESKVKVKRG